MRLAFAPQIIPCQQVQAQPIQAKQGNNLFAPVVQGAQQLILNPEQDRQIQAIQANMQAQFAVRAASSEQQEKMHAKLLAHMDASNAAFEQYRTVMNEKFAAQEVAAAKAEVDKIALAEVHRNEKLALNGVIQQLERRLDAEIRRVDDLELRYNRHSHDLGEKYTEGPHDNNGWYIFRNDTYTPIRTGAISDNGIDAVGAARQVHVIIQDFRPKN